MKNKKRFFFILGGIIIIGILAFLILTQFPSKKTNMNNQQVQIIPLSAEEQQKVIQTVLSSDFIQDIPKKNPIALVFFDFENGQRIWQDGFLLGDGQFLSEGEPTIYLMLHSKYIPELNEANLCEVIQTANKNGDLGFESEYGKASLLVKYVSMLKYRDCFGF